MKIAVHHLRNASGTIVHPAGTEISDAELASPIAKANDWSEYVADKRSKAGRDVAPENAEGQKRLGGT